MLPVYRGYNLFTDGKYSQRKLTQLMSVVGFRLAYLCYTKRKSETPVLGNSLLFWVVLT